MFFQIDDQLPVNQKVRRLIEGTMFGQLEGLAALGAWTIAGAASQASLTDGIVSRPDLIRIVLNADLADSLATSLVTAGLWHAHGHDCPRCPSPGAGAWVFHDWSDLGYNKADQVKTTRRKRQELKDPNLIAQVWARDCIDPLTRPGEGLCRYCGELVKRKTTVGDRKPTMDHVDPKRAAGIRNVVLACRACNQHKGNRTPAEAGMTLRPAPRESAPEPRETAPAASSSAPALPAAAEPQGAPRAPETAQDATTRDRPEPTTAPTNLVDHRSKLSRTHATRVHGPWQGQGGVGVGSGEGEAGSPAALTEPSSRPLSKSARRRANRKARHSQPPQPSPATSQVWDAGDHPPVPAPGSLGSPWFGWTGPPSTVEDTTCPAHALPEPCRACASEAGPT